MPTTTMTAAPGTQQIDFEREFAAPADLVYRAMTDPELIPRWLGPRRLTVTVEHDDHRDGGTWRFVHRDADGNQFAFRGVYHGDPSAQSTVRTFEFEGMPGHVSLETLSLTEQDGVTTARGRSVFLSVEDRDGMVASGMEGGVVEGYERLDELLAEMATAVS